MARYKGNDRGAARSVQVQQAESGILLEQKTETRAVLGGRTGRRKWKIPDLPERILSRGVIGTIIAAEMGLAALNQVSKPALYSGSAHTPKLLEVWMIER